MTMCSDISEKIENIMNTELSEVESQIKMAVDALESKFDEIETTIRAAISDLENPDLIEEVQEQLISLAEEL